MDLGLGIRKALAKFTGASIVDEVAVKELVKDLQRALITSDVNVKLVFELTKKIEKRALEEKKHQAVDLRSHIVKIVYDELVAVLGEAYAPNVEKKQRILLCGLFGVGKTTTIAKLARFYQKHGLKVGVIAGDIHRPAAVEQLQQLSEQVKFTVFADKKLSAKELAEKGSVALDHSDVIIFDSAGRSAFDSELANELRDINAEFKPTSTFLVVSADLGQVAGKQASEFKENANITGVIITKMDGSGKGGGALSSVAVSQSRVAFIGTGEKPDALETFSPDKFVSRLVGAPDLQELLTRVREATDENDLAKAMSTGELDYESFLAQMRSMKKMGPLKQVMQMMGVYDIPEEFIVKSEDKLKNFENIVGSMTKNERKDTKLIKNASRQERVAKGAGVKLEDVRELIKNFENASKMMKGLQGNKSLMRKMSGKMNLPKGMDISKLMQGMK